MSPTHSNASANQKTNISALNPWFLWLVFPVLCLVVGGLLLPKPKNAAEQKQADKEAGTQLVFEKAPKTRLPLNINLQDKIRIVGANLPSKALSRGAEIEVETVFEALKSMKKDWEIFMHIDKAQGGNYRIHGDHHPASGRMKTSAWGKGDFILDKFSPRVPLEAPSGKYDVWMGFYSGSNRLRFKSGDKKFHDGENRIRLGAIIVK